MPDPTRQYEKLLKARISAINNLIRKIYEKSITEISFKASALNYKGTLFKLTDYPLLQKQVDRLIEKMQPRIYAAVVNSMKDSWDLSNKKNDVIVDQRLAGRGIKKKVRQVLYDPNHGALQSFIDRKEKGLNLSDRVWNSLDPFKKELEQSLGLGIGKGQSAVTLANEIKKYLNHPDKLFRRVRNDEGKLVLSKSARNFHPGQGVYRSSFQNALRLAGTETNIAYRTSDHTRWNKLPFVLGIQVKTSNNHPVPDICDELAGEFPKDFVFKGWHPRCRCFATPKTMSDEEYNQMEDQILAGDEVSDSPNAVATTHDGFKDFVRTNHEKISKWKTKPYFLTDNKQYVAEALNPPAPISIDEIIAKIEERIRGQEFESAALFKNDCQVFFKDGEESSVSFSDEEVEQMAGGILTHNHPGSRSFSRADVNMFLMAKMDEVRITSRSYDYSLKLGNFDFSFNLQDVLQKYRDFDNEVHDEFMDKILDDKMTIDDANAEHHHQIMLRLSKFFGFNYIRISVKK